MSEDLTSVTPEQAEALRIAGELIDAGAPIFNAKPCPPGCTLAPGHGIAGYHMPPKWQLTVPSRVWLERYRPGDALCLVGGHVLDILDEDPRAGGNYSVQELQDAGEWPRVYGMQTTPSGGRHYLIQPTGMARVAGSDWGLPGLDLQSGDTGGQGRAFAFIAPTVKASKEDGSPGTYRWVKPPDLEMLAEFAGSDDSIEGVQLRVANHRARRAAPQERSTDDPFLTASQASTVSLSGSSAGGVAAREFTQEQAREFLRPTLVALAEAPLGAIEEHCNRAAAALSHFVPAFFSIDEGMGLLRRQLAHTAYDESHPASAWTVEKFRAVLSGARPTLDPWVAGVRSEVSPLTKVSMEAAAREVSGDEVDALLSEMLSLGEVGERLPPVPLVKGLLNLDSEAWLIGPAGSKKSFVMLDMMNHVALGLPWQGMRTTQADVIIIAAEGAGGIGKRVKAWEKTYGALPANVRVLPRPVQAGDVKAWAVLVRAAERLLSGRPGCVVVDTQARVTVGLEENSAMDMGHYVAAVGAIRRATGACVLTIHHTGRKGGDARGSSAIDGAQDTELKVESSGLSGTLSAEKQKDMEELPPLKLRFDVVDVGEDEDGDRVTSLVLLEPDAWRDAEVETVDHGQEVKVREPEAWTFELAPHIKQGARRQILQTLRDVAGGTGRTEAQVKKIVLQRWYGGKTGRRAGQLREDTWARHWTELCGQEWECGEMVLTQPAGQRWALNPMLVDTLPALPDLP